MNKLKFLLVITIALFSFNAVSAQATKKKAPVKAKTAMHYRCPMKCEGDKTYHKNGKCPVCDMQMKSVKASTAHAAYQCPMKCEGKKSYSKAGKCPVCNMDMKKMDHSKMDHSKMDHKM